jgi:hypothetical protein
LGKIAVEALGISPEQAESYGKGAIVGPRGELEHAAAILHPKLGGPFREAVGGGKALIPSAKKIGGPGTEIDVPVHYKDAAFVRTHFDAMPVRVQVDVFAEMKQCSLLVVTTSETSTASAVFKDQAKKEDGLR